VRIEVGRLTSVRERSRRCAVRVFVETFKVGEALAVTGHPATNGAPGVDVLGKGTGWCALIGKAAP
jgi:hypothetical protein